MKKVLLQKFGSSPPDSELAFTQVRRPSVYKNEYNRKAWSKNKLHKTFVQISKKLNLFQTYVVYF